MRTKKRSIPKQPFDQVCRPLFERRVSETQGLEKGLSDRQCLRNEQVCDPDFGEHNLFRGRNVAIINQRNCNRLSFGLMPLSKRTREEAKVSR
jgi:hypothetical protein